MKEKNPTDDERELSERLVARHLPLSAPSETAANIVRHLTEVGLLCRSEVPEPNAERDEELTRERDHHGIDPEPQGEPSDAEHQVAWAEYRKDFQPNVAHLHREAIAFREGWSAALRAAVGAK